MPDGFGQGEGEGAGQHHPHGVAKDGRLQRQVLRKSCPVQGRGRHKLGMLGGAERGGGNGGIFGRGGRGIKVAAQAAGAEVNVAQIDEDFTERAGFAGPFGVGFEGGDGGLHGGQGGGAGGRRGGGWRAVGEDGGSQGIDLIGQPDDAGPDFGQHPGGAKGGAELGVIERRSRDVFVQINPFHEGQHQAAAVGRGFGHDLLGAEEQLAAGFLGLAHQHLLGHEAAVVGGQVGGEVVELGFEAQEIGQGVQAFAQGLLGGAVGQHPVQEQRQGRVPAAAGHEQGGAG